jgi:NAD(P)-dependent dehydrogenase (short-subunit alcohol dehydrogenase family)
MSETKVIDRGYVVVTGTSTGIGAATALHLAKQGFTVFAGVRDMHKSAGGRRGLPGEVRPLHIDLKDEASISSAAQKVATAVGARGLAGLVNNAGIVKPAPIEFQPLADFREQLEVNLVAHVAVIQAFLPLIRLGRGRIVNVGSIGGRIVLPIHGAYSASKFGMEALSDALRLELKQWRIPVSLVDPGATDTAIFGKTVAEIDRLKTTLGEDGYHLYEEQIAAMRKVVEKTGEDADPAVVLAKTIDRALTSDKPKARYLAGKGAKEAAVLARTASDRVKDAAIIKDVKLPKPK